MRRGKYVINNLLSHLGAHINIHPVLWSVKKFTENIFNILKNYSRETLW